MGNDHESPLAQVLKPILCLNLAIIFACFVALGGDVFHWPSFSTFPF